MYYNILFISISIAFLFVSSCLSHFVLLFLPVSLCLSVLSMLMCVLLSCLFLALFGESAVFSFGITRNASQEDNVAHINDIPLNSVCTWVWVC